MTSVRDAVQRGMPGNLPEVRTGDRLFYAASQFTTLMGGHDWRIYWMHQDGGEGWLLRFTGPDAEIKAKAISMILNAEDTS
jgi:hypothetical protein